MHGSSSHERSLVNTRTIAVSCMPHPLEYLCSTALVAQNLAILITFVLEFAVAFVPGALTSNFHLTARLQCFSASGSMKYKARQSDQSHEEANPAPRVLRIRKKVKTFLDACLQAML